MNFSRTHKKLTRLVLSTLITSALFVAATQGFTTAAVASNLNNDLSGPPAADWSGSNDPSEPDSGQTPQSAAVEPSRAVPPLSATQLKKLNEFLAANGHDELIGEGVVSKLGLTKKQLKQLSLRDKKSGDIHAYSPLPDGGMLVSFIDTTTAYNYRLDSNFKVVASVAMTKHVPSGITDPEAGARAELAFWAHVADQL